MCIRDSYNALAPAAVALQNMSIELDVILDEAFADTQSRDYLIRRCAERGITPEPATRAVLKGVFNMDIPIGTRFSLDRLNYTAVERLEAGIYKLQCETYGEEGNRYFGNLIPIDYVEGLTTADLTEVLIPGEDEETTEQLRSRYFGSLEMCIRDRQKTDRGGQSGCEYRLLLPPQAAQMASRVSGLRCAGAGVCGRGY